MNYYTSLSVFLSMLFNFITLLIFVVVDCFKSSIPLKALKEETSWLIFCSVELALFCVILFLSLCMQLDTLIMPTHEWIKYEYFYSNETEWSDPLVSSRIICYFEYMFTAECWNLSGKQTRMQLIRKHLSTVIPACWATVYWSWPKEWI